MASHARNAIWTGGFAILLALICLSVTPAAPASADQLLVNGGFENGASSWTGPGFSASDSCARSGSSGGLLSASIDDLSASMSQSISPASVGTYTLRGYIKLAPGSAAVRVATANLQLFRSVGSQPNRQTVAVTANWTQFTVTVTESQSTLLRVASSLTIETDVAASVCVDDFTLEGPGLATSTPTATSTPLPTDTPTPTPTSTPTETPVPTAGPSSTPVPDPTIPPLSTATTEPATAGPATATAIATVRPTSTPAAAAPSLVFANGGFEDGLDSWLKFGGELRAVANPRNSGALSGALSSATSSTKWAYQVVRVDPALVYEFYGSLMPADGVSQAYLRISWYASSDGSGAAIATDDSTTRASGSSNNFVRLTTGPKSPPPDARTARVRVLLTPSGAASASLYIDDVGFGAVTPPTAPPPPSRSVAPEEPPEPQAPTTAVETSVPPGASTPQPTARASVSPTARASSTPRPSASTTPAASATKSSDELVLQRAATPIATLATTLEPRRVVDEPSGGTPTEVLAGAVVILGLAGAGAYVWSKKRPTGPV